jgi:hypothetical protein
LRAEVTAHRHTVEEKVKNPPVAKTKTVEQDEPCTRMVPVCVTDPHTGCRRTEYQPQTVLRKVTHTVIEVCPPEQECSTKKVEKVEHCVTIHLERRPVVHEAPCH